MRFRSEWLTIFTLTAAVAGALALPRGDSPGPVAAKRFDAAFPGIDDRPVGSIKASDRPHGQRAKPVARHS